MNLPSNLLLSWAQSCPQLRATESLQAACHSMGPQQGLVRALVLAPLRTTANRDSIGHALSHVALGLPWAVALANNRLLVLALRSHHIIAQGHLRLFLSFVPQSNF